MKIEITSLFFLNNKKKISVNIKLKNPNNKKYLKQFSVLKSYDIYLISCFARNFSFCFCCFLNIKRLALYFFKH